MIGGGTRVGLCTDYVEPFVDQGRADCRKQAWAVVCDHAKGSSRQTRYKASAHTRMPRLPSERYRRVFGNGRPIEGATVGFW